MMPFGWWPLAGGFGLTSALIAWSDLKEGWLYMWEMYPAALGVGIFYWRLGTAALPASITAVILIAFSLPMTYGILWYFDRRAKTRDQDHAISTKGDYLVLALFSFWPVAWPYVMIGAFTIAYVGMRTRFFNRGKHPPLAGLMGLVCLLYLAVIFA
jgi:hypothetical protein